MVGSNLSFTRRSSRGDNRSGGPRAKIAALTSRRSRWGCSGQYLIGSVRVGRTDTGPAQGHGPRAPERAVALPRPVVGDHAGQTMTSAEHDRSTQDVGNVLGLEHVNLVVPDRDIADRFYITGLGFTRDAYMDLGMIGTTWVNLGSQQFHLVHGTEPQRLRGEIGLVVPAPDSVARRLTRLVDRFEPLASTAVACIEDDHGLLVTGPWGNRFRLHGPDDVAGVELGMPYVSIDVAPGTSEAIAAFYREALAAPALVDTTADGRPRAAVAVGRHQHLYFTETEQPIPDYDGHHIAVYLHNFSSPYHWLTEHGLISRETDEHEYRFIQIVDPADGSVCTELEHEVRSMFHPMFGRDLVNRDPRQGLGTRYRRGHDASPGLHTAGVG